MEVKVQFTAKMPIKITKKRKWYVAACPILDVCSQGETETKAKNNLRDALSLFFISCFERGTLDAVLKQCGFKAAHKEVRHHVMKPLAPREDYINIPIPFLVDQDCRKACHA